MRASPRLVAVPAAAVALALLALLGSPIAGASHSVVADPFIGATEAGANVGFTHAGIRGDTYLFEEGPMGGACWGDYDADGDPDLYVTNSNADAGATSKLYRNNGNGGFTDVTTTAGVGAVGLAQACAWGDYDNDGYADLYVTFAARSYAPQGNILYRNDRDGTFTDVTAVAGVRGDSSESSCGSNFQVAGGEPRQGCWSMSAAWLDYDNDGALDLYVTQYVEVDRGDCSSTVPNPAVCFGQPNRLYRSNGDGTFTNVAADLGVEYNGGPWGGRSLGVVAADIDHNGWMDIYVTNDKDANALYMNDGGSFSSVATTRGVDNSGTSGNRAGMGVDAQDFDNDGKTDLLSTHYDGEKDAVYHNNGDDHWTDAHAQFGVDHTFVPRWGGGFVDFNNDGRRDLIVVAGNPQSSDAGEAYLYFWKAEASKFELARNTWSASSEISFDDVTVARNHRTAAFADYDSDGDMDVFATTLVEVTENPQSGEFTHTDHVSKLIRFNFEGAGSDHAHNEWKDNHWLGLRLQGVTSNRQAVGAVVKLTTEDGDSQWLLSHSGGSYAGTNDARLRFGIADETSGTIEITWPATAGCENERVQSFSFGPSQAVKADQYNVIVEPCDLAPAVVDFGGDQFSDHRSIRVSWTQSFASDFQKYVLYHGTSPGFDTASAEKKEITNPQATSFTFTNLAPETSHYFRVRVVDASGQTSDLSPELHVRTKPEPPAPVTLNAPTDVGATALTVSWTESASPSFRAYRLHADTEAGFTPSGANEVGRYVSRDTLSAAVTDLRDATTYYLTVLVEGAELSLSAPSNVVSATTQNAPPPAVQLTPPEGDDFRDDSVTLSWSASAAHDFLRYHVELFVAAGDEAGKLVGSENVTSAAQTSAVFDGIKDNTDYEAFIRVVDAGGLESEIDGIEFRSPDAPPEPVALLPLDDANLTAASVRVVWSSTDITDFAKYRVEVSRLANFSDATRVEVADRDTTAATVTGLRDATTYFVRVVLVDTTGARAPSDAVEFVTPNAPPPAPTEAPAIRFGPQPGAASFSWSASDAHDFDRYEIHLGRSSSFTPEPGTLLSAIGERDVTSRTFLGLSGSAFARVVVVDAGGLASASPAVPFSPAALPRAPGFDVSSPAPRIAVLDLDVPSALEAATLRVHLADDLDGDALVGGTGAMGRAQVVDAPVGESVCFVVVLETATYEFASEPRCLAIADGTAADVRRALLLQRPLSAAGERAATLSWWTPEEVAVLVEAGPTEATLARVPGTPTVEEEAGGYRYTLEVRGLQPSTAYAWRVNATAPDGFSAELDPQAFVTKRDRTAPPPLVRVTAARDSAGVLVTWTPSPAIDVRGYLVYRADGSGDFVAVHSAEGLGTSWLDEDAPAGAVRYRVVAADEHQNILPASDGTEAVVMAAAVVPAAEEQAAANAESAEEDAVALEERESAAAPVDDDEAAVMESQALDGLQVPFAAAGAVLVAAAGVAVVWSHRRGGAR